MDSIRFASVTKHQNDISSFCRKIESPYAIRTLKSKKDGFAKIKKMALSINGVITSFFD